MNRRIPRSIGFQPVYLKTFITQAGSLCYVLLATLLTSPFTNADDKAEFFENKVRPLLIERCVECHNEDYIEAELRLDVRELAQKGGVSGSAIMPGDPKNSLLIQVVKGTADDVEQMPLGDELSEDDIAVLEKWVADGAVWPSTEAMVKDKAKHWAYEPLIKAEPSAEAEDSSADTDASNANQIDSIIIADLQERGLRRVETADRLTLLRRLKFNLLGLPPTIDEIEDVQKSGDDWYERYVTRFLASPHYGERWGRHWLDVVRYADTNGSVADMPLDEAWRYRNYVIDAFSDDMPYDQFVREQLAGDLINEREGLPNPLRGLPRYVDRPPVEPWTHIGQVPEPKKVERNAGRPDKPLTETQKRRYIATGYLALSRRHGSEHSLYPHHLTIDDTIDNFGKAFLGLSYGCARCHDHKFDAVSSEDYYGLYGIFASTRLSWCGVELSPHPRDLIPLIPQQEFVKLNGQAAKATSKQRGRVFKLWKEWQAAWRYELENPDDAEAARRQLVARTALWSASKREGKLRMEAAPSYEAAYGAVDSDLIGDAPILVKGDWKTKGPVVPRSFPRVLDGGAIPEERVAHVSGRLELAEWLTDPEKRSGVLLARVMANRIWTNHFGAGLVTDPNDFGIRSSGPSNAELLDYLASSLIESGWSIKSLHRKILNSQTYQLATTSVHDNEVIDPSNRYLWRQNRRRLDAETLRDTLLFVSGQLDMSPMDQSHPFNPLAARMEYTQHHPFEEVYEHNHRSVYLMMKRMKKHPYFLVFDGPDRVRGSGVRSSSVTTPQALFMLNNPMIHDAASRMTQRVQSIGLDRVEQIQWFYQTLLGRSCSPIEETAAKSFLDVPGAQTRERLETYVRALLRTNEFLYVN